MITNCPVCGKGFDILWPHLWRYKRGNSYLCSWKCLRLTESERKKEEEVYKKPAKRVRMKPEDMATALMLFQSGDSSLDQFLKDHGITHIAKWKHNAKQRHPEPVDMMKLNGPILIDTPEASMVKIVETPGQLKPVPPPIEYKVTGISTAVGDFQYLKKAGYIDWTTLTGETVSMNLEEWKELMRIWPFILKVLGVEM